MALNLKDHQRIMVIHCDYLKKPFVLINYYLIENSLNYYKTMQNYFIIIIPMNFNFNFLNYLNYYFDNFRKQMIQLILYDYMKLG